MFGLGTLYACCWGTFGVEEVIDNIGLLAWRCSCVSGLAVGIGWLSVSGHVHK